jgi:hypothetical protein
VQLVVHLEIGLADLDGGHLAGRHETLPRNPAETMRLLIMRNLTIIAADAPRPQPEPFAGRELRVPPKVTVARRADVRQIPGIGYSATGPGRRLT